MEDIRFVTDARMRNLPRVVEDGRARSSRLVCMDRLTCPGGALILFFLLFSSLCGCGSGVSKEMGTSTIPPHPGLSPIWVGSWGDSMTDANANADNGGGGDRTFRFLVTSTIDGTEARVKFSNVYGSTPVTIGAARLGLGQNGTPAVNSSQNVSLSFNGGPSTVLAAGSTVTSDPVAFSFGAGQVLAISVYLKGTFGPVSRHDSYFVTNYATPNSAGDATADTGGTGFTSTLGDWLLVNEVDVYGPYQGTLAMFGSSTTDGFKSNYGDTAIYPAGNVPLSGQTNARVSDWMSRRLLGLGYRIGVINAGIPSDTIEQRVSSSPSATDRIAQDVLSLPNLLAIVTYFGSIDLRACRYASGMENATEHVISLAHAANFPVIMATLPPSAFCTNQSSPNAGPVPNSSDPYAGGINSGAPNGAEVQRAAFNAWVRSTGASLPGVVAIADYDLALRDPQHISFMLPQYNSGDNQHMNGNGYGAEAHAVPLGVLPPSLNPFWPQKFSFIAPRYFDSDRNLSVRSP